MASRKIGVISGGSGSSKFVGALEKFLPSHSLKPQYVANVGDNFWHYGLYICPDVDILMYTLSGRLDDRKGWGIKYDSFNFVKSYSLLYPDEAWFNLGDSDLALCLRRTELLRGGWKLSKITEHFRRLFGIDSPIIPATDDSVQTFIGTKNGSMHLQEFWVKNKGEPEVTRIYYSELSKAKPNAAVRDALSGKVLILPANPVSSVLPTINLPHVRSFLKEASSVVAISPFVGSEPFSGPASKFMRALGVESSSYGVAVLYHEFLRILLVHIHEETKVMEKIKGMGIECIRTNTFVRSAKDKEKLVNEVASIL